MYKGLIHRYRDFLPVTENTPFLSLCEGNTPLIPLHRLSEKLNVQLFVKYEGLNPTGSFKDRGMVVAMAKAKESGAKAVICASTGNTSASAAAYATRANMKAIIVIPNGKIALGKLAQAIMYGAEIVSIDGNFDDALTTVRDIASSEPITLVNSVNPYRIEGQKTAAFEIIDDLGEAPDVVCIPVGNAGNITAYWKGFNEYATHCGYSKPRMHGFQAEGAAPIVKGYPIEKPETLATAIRIGNPASWQSAVTAIKDSFGHVDAVTDEEIIEAYQLLASHEGIFAEPGSCASVAGLIKDIKLGRIKPNEKVVLILTGNGLKDPDTALKYSQVHIHHLHDTNDIMQYVREAVTI